MAGNGQSQRLAGLPAVDYYAPNFKIEVEGKEIDPESKGDVLEVKVTMDLENLTSFDLTVNNWDDKHFGFKYSDTTIFDAGNRVHIRMGYADDLRFMASGLISTLSPKFTEAGPPTLGVAGVDAMLKLRDRKPVGNDVKQFVNKYDWEIAQVIAARNHLDVKVTQDGPQQALVIQKNQDDATFLMERAKRIDFDCYIRIDPDTGRDTLYFMRPTDARDGRAARVYVFEWGKTLINFNPQLKLGQQVSKVTVRGWDPRTKSPITYTAGPSDLPNSGGSGDSGPDLAAKRLSDKQDVVVDQPVASMQEARELAMSLLRERAYQYLTGSGEVIGLPDLRPGDNIELKGLGKRFSAEYYVTKVEHSLGSNGYLTSFDVRSCSDGGTK
ncbi:MAG TPA: type IV secretion protein Rhs [Methylomirabilota bacterium]|nr:type IV secretion protein Rhs [Methylomirabilota bacterium]